MWHKLSRYAAISMCMQIASASLVFSPMARAAGPIAQANSVADGKALFAQCSACHSLSPSRNGRGPTLYHLFGRKAGTVAGYDYSMAMENADIVWRDDTLARFLANPKGMVRGTTMMFAGLPNPQQAKELIAYLRGATH